MSRGMVSKVLPFVLLLLVPAAFAQTYTQQPGQVGCVVNSFICQNVPMTSGDKYTISAKNDDKDIDSGNPFSWDSTQGAVSGVIVDLPPFWAPGFYPGVKYTISLPTGKNATVTCDVTIKPLGRWPQLFVSNTLIVFN